MPQLREIPDGYERVEHHDNLTLHNEEKGIVISVHERDEIERTLLDRFPYKVAGSKNQASIYSGTFDSLSHAEDKVFELAQRH